MALDFWIQLGDPAVIVQMENSKDVTCLKIHMASVALVLAFVAPVLATDFPLELPFAKEKGLALSKMNFQTLPSCRAQLRQK